MTSKELRRERRLILARDGQGLLNYPRYARKDRCWSRGPVLRRRLSKALKDLMDSGVSTRELAERIGCKSGTITRLANSAGNFRDWWIPALVYGLGMTLGPPDLERNEHDDPELAEAFGAEVEKFVDRERLRDYFTSIGRPELIPPQAQTYGPWSKGE